MEETSKITELQLSAKGRAANHQIRGPRASSNLALSFFRDGVSTASLRRTKKRQEHVLRRMQETEHEEIDRHYIEG